MVKTGMDGLSQSSENNRQKSMGSGLSARSPAGVGDTAAMDMTELDGSGAGKMQTISK